MAPVSNKRVTFKSYSKGTIVPGETIVFDPNPTIDLDNVHLNGGVLLKTLILSLAPGIHAKMIENIPYVSFKLGDPINSGGIAVVVRSEDPAFQVGDHVHGYLNWEEYSIRHDVKSLEKVENKHNLPWSLFLGPAGLPGMTAYFGWREYAHAKKGDTVFVSSGAGAVGSFVIQLAKRQGLKVIASAGSDEKVRFMKELGADVPFNYKTSATSDVLSREGPIDVYWDNVGGETLVDALDAATKHARFIECGMVSTYGRTPIIPNLVHLIVKEIKMSGFLVHSLAEKYADEFDREILPLLHSGDLKYRENVTQGLENAEATFSEFLEGAFTGKAIIVVANE